MQELERHARALQLHVHLGRIRQRPALISDNYFCRLATTTSAGGSAVWTACATVRS